MGSQMTGRGGTVDFLPRGGDICYVARVTAADTIVADPQQFRM